MKRTPTISLILALAIILGVTLVPAYAAEGMSNFQKTRTYEDNFTDISNDEWYAENVKSAYELELVNGTSSTKFSPAGNVTIAETIALAARLNNIFNGSETTFEQGSPWYQVYVDYAIENNIIDEGQYGSYQLKANRAQFAIILSRAFPEGTLASINGIPYGNIPDIPVKSSYGDAAYLLYRSGILTGIDKYATFNPYSYIQRSEVATIVTRMADPSLRRTFTIEAKDEDQDTVNINQALDLAYDNGKFQYVGVGSYSGELKSAVRSGNGTFTWNNGDSYDGTWKNDQMLKGTYKFADGRVFYGEFKDNLFSSGTLNLTTTSSESGYSKFAAIYKDGSVSGLDFKTSEGLSYKGDISGEASITYISGNKYTGHVSNGQRSGYGTFSWTKDGTVEASYEGNWSDGIMSGEGKYHYSGSVYPYVEGTFLNGKPDGTALYYKDESSVYTSVWKDGSCISLERK